MTEPRSIAILTGAGISAPSGIPTFRDETGVWNTHDLSAVCTLSGWHRDRDLVNKFHDEARRAVQDAEPNAAHLALAAWESAEEARGNAFTILTQNVDDLHERAGSNTVIHLHGEILRVSCETCGMELRWINDLLPGPDNERTDCPFCGADALRPAVTWFGEYPPHFEDMDAHLAYADLLVIIGTSGAIYGSGSLAAMVRSEGGRAVFVNLEAPENPEAYDQVIVGSAEQVVPQLVAEYLEEHDPGRIEAGAREGEVR